MIQSEALTILKTGANVFITGPAGSGKTHVVNEYIAYLLDHGVPVGITASTGIAATHLGGMTIHSWAGIGVKDTMSEFDLDAITEKIQTRRRLQETAVLVIDEVSMLHHFRLDLIDRVLRHVRGKISGKSHLGELPFGGMQVILCGDFFQLPPVSRYGDPKPRFAYASEAWKDGGFSVCYLSENYRQVDDVSLSILNEIRSGEVSDEAREHLRGRHVSHVSGISNIQTSATDETDSHPSGYVSNVSHMPKRDIEPTRLFTHNVSVDGVNETELGKIPGPEAVYEMTSRGRKPLVEMLKKSCLAPETLRLRKGARVMCVKNNFEKGYVNGTLGVVVSCGPGVDPVIKTAGSASGGQNGTGQSAKTITIEQANWTIEDGGKVLAEINQYPLRLAWAITVHKSQGMSLDAIEVDLSRSFEPGMGYVALSRVRTLAGLTILGMNEAALQVHPEVLEYDRELRQLSENSKGQLAAEDMKDIVRKQEEFLAKVAPMHRMGKDGKMTKLTRERERKISTFEKTAELVRREKSLKEIAKDREVTVETVIAHLEQLIRCESEFETLELADIAYLKYEISPQYFNKIETSLAEIYDADPDRPPLLSPVKSQLGPNISFKDIRLARVILGYIRKSSEKK